MRNKTSLFIVSLSFLCISAGNRNGIQKTAEETSAAGSASVAAGPAADAETAGERPLSETSDGYNHAYSEGDVSVKKDEGVLILTTGEDSYLETELFGKATVTVSEDSSFTAVQEEEMIILELIRGAIRAGVDRGDTDRFSVSSPVAVAAVRGTEFSVIYEEEGASDIEVYDGEVKITPLASPADEMILDPGFFTRVTSEDGLGEKKEITDKQRLRWEHIVVRKSHFRLLRERNRLRTEILSARGDLRGARGEEAERLREQIKALAAKRTDTDKKLKAAASELEEISARYRKVIREPGLRRKKMRLKERERILNERLERLEKREK